MLKGQSLIIQFILFFVIGFGVFLSVGQFFNLQREIFRSDITDRSLKLTNSYLSSAIILLNSCKQCDNSKINLRLENTTAGYNLMFKLENNLLTTAASESISANSSVHNLSPFLLASGRGVSTKTLTLTLDKTKNELRVS